jgi:transcriptional regulator with XRE-family HTH domain
MFVSRLENLRSSRKLTQKEIAGKLGIARTTYSGYENGTREPDHEMLQKMADLFDVSVDYLLGRTNNLNQVISDDAKNLLDALDLADADIAKKYEIFVDGQKLSEEQIKEFISYVRVVRSKNK